MCVYIYVVVLCMCGLWDVQHVTSVTVDVHVVKILHDIQYELNNLKLLNDRNERKIVRLERQVGVYHTKYAEVAKQTSSVARIESRVADIERKVEKNRHELVKRLEVEEIVRTIIEMDHDSQDNRSAVDEVKMNVFETEDENGPAHAVAKEKKHHSNKRIIPVTSSKTRIAFTAYAPMDLQRTYGRTAMVPFNGIQTNEGDGFNPTTHIFTCPVSGVYFFTSSVASYISGLTTSGSANNQFITEMVKDGTMLVETYSTINSAYSSHYMHTSSNLYVHPNSNTIVTMCDKGQTVWVRYRLSNISMMYIAFSGRYTTFSGFLLWEV